MADWALEVFGEHPNTLKILDLDHFSWTDVAAKHVARKETSRFNERCGISPDEHVMQYHRLKREYDRRGKTVAFDEEQICREIDEMDRADAIITPVSFVRDAIVAAGYPENRIHVVPYRYDPDLFYPPASQQSIDGPLRLLFAGTVSVRKGWFYLREIIEALGDRRDVSFVIAGGVSDDVNADFRQFVDGRDYVEHVGFVRQSRLSEIMRTSDLFVFPSVLEGYGLTVLQAMACGLPVVTSDATCGVDLVTSELHGRVMSTFDTDAWVEAVNDVRTHLSTRPRAVRQALCSTTDSLTWNRYAHRLLQVVEEHGVPA